MPRSLVIGVNGQDGSYLAEALLRRGHDVIGCGRGETSHYVGPSRGFTYERVDLCDPDALAALLRRSEPNNAFHFAAVHGAAGFEYEEVWHEMMAVNVLSLHVLLEHARLRAPAMRVLYAGSAKIFPSPLSGKIDEATPARATCLYSIGKMAARDLICQYQARHHIAATNLVLFNHESPRRPRGYFLPVIGRAISRAKIDRSFRTSVKTLDFWIDWSAAEELMDIVADVAERCRLPEVILASGKTWHGRQAVEELFARDGLDVRDHITETLPRSDPGPEFQADIGALVKAVGRRPMRQLGEIVDELIESFATEMLPAARN